MSHRIDWRRFFEQALEFLCSASGGVVLVRGDESAAAPLFARLLREDLASEGWCFVTLGLTGDDGANVDELCANLLSRLGLELEGPRSARIGADTIKTMGNVTFQHNTINYGGDAYETARRRRDAIATLHTGVGQHLATSRVVLVVESGVSALARAFWSELWGNCLGQFTNHGLFLVSVSGVADAPVAGSPPPDLILDLPSVFAPTDEQIAIADMVNILAQIAGPSPELAVICKTVMVSAGRRPADLHSLFPLHVIEQRRSRR